MKRSVVRERPLSLAEQEVRFAAALDPGRAVARDLVAAEEARLQAALPGLTAAEREQVAAGCTLGERSRRLVELLARRQQAAEVAKPSTVAAPAERAKRKARPRSKPVKRARKPAARVAPIDVVKPIDVDDVPHLERITDSRRRHSADVDDDAATRRTCRRKTP